MRELKGTAWFAEPRDVVLRILSIQFVPIVCASLLLLVAGLAERVAQPFETLVQTVSGSGAGGLDVL